jgi:hypothetical protein
MEDDVFEVSRTIRGRVTSPSAFRQVALLSSTHDDVGGASVTGDICEIGAVGEGLVVILKEAALSPIVLGVRPSVLELIDESPHVTCKSVLLV